MTKVEHRLYKIQYNDEAIEGLKYNKKLEARQRIKVHFKNGPRGITLRWTPKTNKKVFQLIFKFRKKSYVHDCGEYTPEVYTCNKLDEYLVALNKKHRNKDGSFKSNPNNPTISHNELKYSQLKKIKHCIEDLCKDNFPRANIEGNLSSLSTRDHTRFLIGYNKRREHITFEDDEKGWGQIKFKEFLKVRPKVINPIKDWDTLFKTYPSGTGCDDGDEVSIYDSNLADILIDDLIPGNIEIFLNSIPRSYGQKENIRKALACMWTYAREKGFMGPNPPVNPTRKEKGGIKIKKSEVSKFKGSIYNDMSFSVEELHTIEDSLIKLRDQYPFQSECLRLLLNTGMRKEEGMKLERSHITKDEYGDQIILMKRTITKGRTNQKQTDIVYDITENIVPIFESLEYQLNKPEYKSFRFVPWLFPSTMISINKLADPKKFPDYAKKHSCRVKTLDDCWEAVRDMTGLTGAIKTLRKAFTNATNETLGGAHRGKHITKHITELTPVRSYDKASVMNRKKMAKQGGQVLMFKRDET